MHTFKVEKVIPHPTDAVWAQLDDFADTWVYHPVVRESVSLNGQRAGLGAERQCSMYSGGAVKERITRYDAADRSYDVEVYDHGPFPLVAMDITLSVAPAEGGARVTMDGRFTPKYGPLGWVMGAVMMKPQFVRMLGQVIDGLDQHLATGRIVGQGGALGAPLNDAAAGVPAGATAHAA